MGCYYAKNEDMDDADARLMNSDFPDDAAEEFAEMMDAENCHYPASQVVFVRKEWKTEWHKFVVTGEHSGRYRATEAKS